MRHAFLSIFAAIVLGAVAVSASATTVTDWGTLGPDGMDARAYTTAPGPVDDVYTFSLGDYSDVPSTANYYTATSLKGVSTVNLQDATLSLYSGTYGTTGDSLVGSYLFGTSMTDHTFSGLTSGNYYFEVTGTATGTKGSDYYFNAEAVSTTPPLPAVPEPSNMMFLMAGIASLSVMLKRRQRN